MFRAVESHETTEERERNSSSLKSCASLNYLNPYIYLEITLHSRIVLLLFHCNRDLSIPCTATVYCLEASALTVS